MNKFLMMTLCLLTSVTAHAAEISGHFTAPMELSNGQQLPPVDLSINDDSTYRLHLDGNSCSFEPWGIPSSCTEMATMATTGLLVLVMKSDRHALYALSGSPRVQLLVTREKNSNEVRLIERDQTGRAKTSRTLDQSI